VEVLKAPVSPAFCVIPGVVIVTLAAVGYVRQAELVPVPLPGAVGLDELDGLVALPQAIHVAKHTTANVRRIVQALGSLVPIDFTDPVLGATDSHGAIMEAITQNHAERRLA
jgi:hypothetical protein